MSTLRVLARFRAKPDCIEELRNALAAQVAPTRAEAGCIVYELLQNLSDPTDFTFVEDWTNEPALAAHAASAHIRAGRDAWAPLVAHVPEIAKYRLVR